MRLQSSLPIAEAADELVFVPAHPAEEMKSEIISIKEAQLLAGLCRYQSKRVCASL